MLKSQALQRWRQLDANQNPLTHMRMIPYKSEGSRYGACGVRIDGNPQFVDAVLSCLKALLAGENQMTRLELSRNAVKPALGRSFVNRDSDAEVCYIRLHERGGEGMIAQALMRQNVEATKEFASAQGLAF
jgi:hypothetical protein